MSEPSRDPTGDRGGGSGEDGGGSGSGAPDAWPSRAAVAALFSDLARYRMPFGRYKGAPLYDLPLPYLLWFQYKGFPEGKLGELLAQVCTIKSEGADHLFDPLRKARCPPN